MLSSPEFKEFGKDVVLFAHITTRIPGRKHDGLLSEKGFRGSIPSSEQTARYSSTERRNSRRNPPAFVVSNVTMG